jgi:hypothetical protein
LGGTLLLIFTGRLDGTEVLNPPDLSHDKPYSAQMSGGCPGHPPTSW